MPMNPNFLCCIGAELKNSTQQTTRMSQVYLYRAFEDQTLNDMLQPGFFNAAMGIIRQDDLLLLYSPNETTAKYTYTRVSNVSSSGVVIERIGIEAESISVDTTGYSNLSGNNLQEILNNLDTTITTINNAFVKKDGSSIMTGPLKFRAGSFEGAIAGGLGDGISVYKLKADGSIDSEVASLTKTNGFVPGTNNAMDIGRNNLKWKDAHIARVITAVINNGYDINVPVTASPDTLALKSEVDNAANSGDQLYSTGVWYAKMYSASTVPTGAEYDGRNYADFSQTDGDGNPVIKIYTGASGAWTLTETIIPPADYNGYMTITSKIWDIVEQAGQQGGKVLWSHNQKTFTPYPQIISFENAALTGVSTAPTPTSGSPDNQIATKGYVDSFSGADKNLSNLTSTGQNIANWSSNVSNCITEIPQDIKLELHNGTLTLKAGSKVYVPNGAVFDTVIIANDITFTMTWGGNSKRLFFVRPNGNDWVLDEREVSFSGMTAPTSDEYSLWFDRFTNFVKMTSDYGSTWTSGLSFPIALVTNTNNVTTSIDHIFNGFGYIGSTVFALPGVKGLIPDGRNADGSLKSVEFTVNNVLVETDLGSSSDDIYIVINSSGILYRKTKTKYTYDKEENLNRYNGADDGTTPICWHSRTSGIISNFTPKQVFHAVDYNEADFVVAFQRPTAENNYTWYRKYKSGWVEQGGVVDLGSDVRDLSSTVNLSVEMANNFYSISVIGSRASSGTASMCIGARSQTTTSFYAFCYGFGNADTARYIIWRVEGMGA